MKRMLAILAVIALAITAFSFMAVETDADSTGILLYEVKSAGTDEGFSLRNYSSADIDLKGYSLTDSLEGKEGTLEFTKSIILSPGESITIVKNDDDKATSKFLNHHTYYLYGQNGITATSKFSFADNGDDLYLLNPKGQTVDAFCYGNVTITDESLWKGQPYQKMSKSSNDFAVRNYQTGGNAKAWHQWGVTTNYFDPDLKFTAQVTPFLFPESGGIPIYETLEKANTSVYITMYELTSSNLYALLIELEKRGVDVTILLEMNPIGYSGLTEDSKKMKALIDAGGEVSFIGGDLSRYSYVHAKYCIIDNKTVIVTSENWVMNNLNCKTVTNPEKGEGNRGWGIIVESMDYAGYMTEVFQNDYDPTYGDVISFEDRLPGTKAATLTYEKPTNKYDTKTYTTTVTPVMSPDSSWDAMIYYIDSATTRVYTEQQSITTSYLDVSTESPFKHLADQAEKSLDVRFILNSTYNTADIEAQVLSINENTHVKAATMTKPYLHNKGLISDDTVLVSSINWTDTSFTKNREMCVVIHSKDVTNFFAGAYTGDFERNYKYDGLDVWITELQDVYQAPGEITVTTNITQTGDLSFEWELDGVKRTTVAARAVFDVTAGEHTLKVRVTDGSGHEGSDSRTFKVLDGSDDSSGIIDKIKPYLIPIIVIVLAILLAIIKASTGGSGKKKKKKGGKKR